MGMDEFWKEVETKSTWDRSKLKDLGNRTGMFSKRTTISIPEDIKIGDIFSSPFGAHPAMIISIKEGRVTAVVLSTTNAPHNIYQVKESRFFKGNYVTFSIISASTEVAKSKYLGYLDSKKDIIAIIKALKVKYKEVLSLRQSKPKLTTIEALINLDEVDNFN